MLSGEQTDEFFADPIKRRCLKRITLRILIPMYAITLLTALLGALWWMLPFAAAMFVNGRLSGYPWYWRKKPLLTITDATIKGPLVTESGWPHLTIRNLPSCPMLVIHHPSRWKRGLGIRFKDASIVSYTTDQRERIYFDISVLSDQDQQTVFNTLKQRYEAAMSPVQ